MRKQFFKMKFKAILKILIPIAFIALLVFMMIYEELEGVEVIVMSCTWGLLCLIYIISGILTLKNGPKQATAYIRNYPAGGDALDEEYEAAQKFGWLRVGHSHAFADASDGFYIVPFEKIINAYVRNEGANPAKGRSGYYYLYMKCDGIGGWDEKIKVYYISRSEAYDALACLEEKCDFHPSEDQEENPEEDVATS